MTPAGSYTALQPSPWQCVATPTLQLAESPRYAHSAWMWLDIDGQLALRWPQRDLSQCQVSGLACIALPESVGCLIPTARPDVALLFGRSGVFSLDWHTGLLQRVAPAPFNPLEQRFNDGRADSSGRVWVSTLTDNRTPGASLYSWTPQHGFTCWRNDLIVGNGSALSADLRTLYVADTRQRTIWKHPLDIGTGRLGPGIPWVSYPPDQAARPDGACLLQDGTYLVAVYEGQRLDRYTPQGEFLESLPTPFAKPTMPALGGPDLQQLCVTAAQDPNNPGGACVAVCRVAVAGVPEFLVA